MPDSPSPPPAAPTAAEAPHLVTAHRAVLAVFALAGIGFSAWASRIADTKATLGLTAGELGATLLFMSAGSLIAMPSTGRIAHRLGAATTVRLGILVSLVGLVGVGLGVDVFMSRWVVAGSLSLIGLGVGVWDVAMNLEGAAVERLLGRTTMPHYHAAFSGGTVVSAFVGAGFSASSVPVSEHLIVVGVALVAAALVILRGFLPRDAEEESAHPTAAVDGVKPRSAWTEPRTLLIGAVTLAAAFTEGTANDWLSVAFVEGHGTPPWAGVLAFATFLSFMTLGRLLGTRLLDTYGRVPVLRVTFAMAVVGSLMVILGSTWVAYLGAAVWGVGSSLGFPVGMSASADDPARAAARMSVVATIGYAAFIAGPPLLGFLGDHLGVLKALSAVSVLTILAMLLLPSVREPEHPAPTP